MNYGNIGGWDFQYGQQNQQQIQQQYKRTIPRVNGEAEIKALQLNPLESIIAIDDSETNVFWVKVMDAAGFPTLKKARFEFIDDAPPSSEYVSKKDFDELSAKFNKLMEELGNGKSDR